MTVALITGASGMLGSALVRRLSSSGKYSVISASRSDVDLLRCDDVIEFFKRSNPEIVFHCAAKVAGLGGNSAFPAEFFDENILINTHVVRASRLAGASKIVAVGTAAIYSDTVPLPMKEADIWEGPPHHSEVAYGVAKRAMLTQLQAYQRQYGLDYGYGILTNLYGPRDTFDKDYGHVVPSLICKIHDAMKAGTPLEVWGNGTPQRDFLFVEDAADALITVAERGIGPFNIASGTTSTIRQLVDVLKEVSGFPGEVLWATDKPNGQLLRQYDLSSIRSLGFASSTNLREGLRETWSWYLDNSIA
ncbi:NAD-dependent epimerase/dehydratase family protein [Pararhizobium sp. LjRoot235]|uniref:NAD-dependent epimerase/dehydratase family protein n=1 Tax=Pararhizobium sp. LjRoot235 TaxID=3342291 RepID=UPI003ECCB6F1